jgi:SAM-dependent methyltransferase
MSDDRHNALMGMRLLRGQDAGRAWDAYGRDNPYYGVLSSDEFQSQTFDAAARDRFFASGEHYIEELFGRIARTLRADFAPRRALDFGCGVGRLVLPLAARCDSVSGVDIAPSMLAEAARNCADAGRENTELIAPAELERLAPEFDLVHSILVFQHIEPRLGMTQIERLCRLLAPGGVAALHVSLRPLTRRGALYFGVMRRLPIAHNLWNLLRRRPWAYPQMQMNRYDLPEVLALMQSAGLGPLVVGIWRDSGSMPFEHATVLGLRPEA